MTIRFTVVGRPIPQGSKTRMPVRGTSGRSVLIEGNSKTHRNLHDWRLAVAAEARAYAITHRLPAPLDEPIVLTAHFYLARPMSMPKRITHHTTKPDLSKLLRSIEDALSGIIYVTDSRIVDEHITKDYAIDSPPRVELTISTVAD